MLNYKNEVKCRLRSTKKLTIYNQCTLASQVPYMAMQISKSTFNKMINMIIHVVIIMTRSLKESFYNLTSTPTCMSKKHQMSRVLIKSS